jgi:hypothetical protein
VRFQLGGGHFVYLAGQNPTTQPFGGPKWLFGRHAQRSFVTYRNPLAALLTKSSDCAGHPSVQNRKTGNARKDPQRSLPLSRDIFYLEHETVVIQAGWFAGCRHPGNWCGTFRDDNCVCSHEGYVRCGTLDAWGLTICLSWCHKYRIFSSTPLIGVSSIFRMQPDVALHDLLGLMTGLVVSSLPKYRRSGDVVRRIAG